MLVPGWDAWLAFFSSFTSNRQQKTKQKSKDCLCSAASRLVASRTPKGSNKIKLLSFCSPLLSSLLLSVEKKNRDKAVNWSEASAPSAAVFPLPEVGKSTEKRGEMRGTELLFRSVIPIGVLLTCDDDAALARRSPANETNFRFSFSLSLSLSLFSLQKLFLLQTHTETWNRVLEIFSLSSLLSSLFPF